jgi:hypothetical protein
MAADGDETLYFGTGREAGTGPYDTGTARVYSFDGTNLRQVFDADGADTQVIDHAGVQCLYVVDDEDEDGVPDSRDVCPGTAIPEAVPTQRLGVNRWALVDADFSFDTSAPKGKGPTRSYSTIDTAGCSCKQIIDALGLGHAHAEFGCSISAMDTWVGLVRR